MKKITDVVFDFDGTCTQVPIISEKFLKTYSQLFNELVEKIDEADWTKARNEVLAKSPNAGWTLGTTPSAPAGADPYILAFETAQYLMRRSKNKKLILPPEIFSKASEANQAPWRTEARDVFESLLQKKVNIHFISNSNSLKITQRLLDLFCMSVLPTTITVNSNAEKFVIGELKWDMEQAIPVDIQKKFLDLPVNFNIPDGSELTRPVYLRRGKYFETIHKALGSNLKNLETTIFCGDIWEMDLAMPYALGANIHFIERTGQNKTHDYEYAAIVNAGERAKISDCLKGLLKWFENSDNT